jgi:hypothetical protein
MATAAGCGGWGMSDQLIEKVACAICEAFGGDGQNLVTDQTGLFRLQGSFKQWEFYRPVAEAAIHAMLGEQAEGDQ